jgi:hypothetical protein
VMSRERLALIVFVAGALVCAVWGYRAAAAMLEALGGTGSTSSGSGGIAGVSMGLPALIVSVVPPVITIWLARAAGSTRLATRWRNAHLAAMLAMLILPMMADLRVMMVSFVVFWPVQVFFLCGALAIWIASPRNRPDTPSEASS